MTFEKGHPPYPPRTDEPRRDRTIERNAYRVIAEVVRQVGDEPITGKDGQPTTRLVEAIRAQYEHAAKGKAGPFTGLVKVGWGSWPESINVEQTRRILIEDARREGMLENPLIRALLLGGDGDGASGDVIDSYTLPSGEDSHGPDVDPGAAGETEGDESGLQEVSEDLPE